MEITFSRIGTWHPSSDVIRELAAIRFFRDARRLDYAMCHAEAGYVLDFVMVGRGASRIVKNLDHNT